MTNYLDDLNYKFSKKQAGKSPFTDFKKALPLTFLLMDFKFPLRFWFMDFRST